VSHLQSGANDFVISQTRSAFETMEAMFPEIKNNCRVRSPPMIFTTIDVVAKDLSDNRNPEERHLSMNSAAVHFWHCLIYLLGVSMPFMKISSLSVREDE